MWTYATMSKLVYAQWMLNRMFVMYCYGETQAGGAQMSFLWERNKVTSLIASFSFRRCIDD